MNTTNSGIVARLGDPRLPARFWAKVVDDVERGCWLWCGWTEPNGYGKFGLKVGQKWTKKWAHRVAFEALGAPVPNGLDLDHLCRVRRCVNPGHLEPVTRQVNLLRGVGFPAVNAAKTHCLRGHAFSGANLQLRPNGWRDCRACMKIRSKRNSERRAQRRRSDV